MVGQWEVTGVSTSLGDRGEKEVRIGDEEMNIGQVVTARG